MNTHPYLRAYMAGVVAPSVGVLVALTVFILTRLVFHVPIPIERVIMFPMGVIPMAFGLWNILYVSTRPHRSWPIGLHGALLLVILVGIGTFFAVSGGFMAIGSVGVTLFQTINVTYSLIATWFVGALALYYLVWKYIVGYLNGVLGVA